MSQTGVVSWSQTAANNATADSTINFAEGQAPSTVNDSARALMTSVAKYRDDIAGSAVTGGTSTAYTLTSNQNFSALTVLHNQMIAFVPNVTSGATPTLNVDSLGAKGIRYAPGIDLPAGALIAGAPYIVTYNNSDGYFYLQNAIFSPIRITASLGADVALNNITVFFDGPSIAQGTSGTWFVSGTVTVIDTGGNATMRFRLWDGSTVIASTVQGVVQNNTNTVSLSGYITSPAGNLRISVKDASNATGKILFNQSGDSKDSTISAVRIG